MAGAIYSIGGLAQYSGFPFDSSNALIIPADWEIDRIVRLREQGLGLYRIAKIVYGDPRKRYKVYRLLKSLELKAGSNGNVAIVSNVSKPEDDNVADEFLPGKPEDGRIEPMMLPVATVPRVGVTQRLVLEALAILVRATPSMIASHVKHVYQINVTRNAIWQALKRLEARGIVVRLPKGVYMLADRPSGILVENVRVRDVQLWSTKENGRPATLEDILILASLRERTHPVSQIEMFKLGTEKQRKKAEALRKNGWSHTIIYYNENQGLKIEHHIHKPPIPLRPSAQHYWISLYKQATELIYELAGETLHPS